ncbi:MAG: hypothetical protein J0H38_03150 [Rhizobiales bacterium]|jgi:hypothetical protein|nr:hypothetical protein [Hyphomicrobiales bacterium]
MRPLPLLTSCLFGCSLVIALTTAAPAEQVARERDITDLRLGQRILVDDGSCPQGQIKEVTGAKLSASGVVRRIVCVPRPGARR